MMNKRHSITGDVEFDVSTSASLPVTLVPKHHNPEAMLFRDAPFPSNIVEIISWLGDAFYAMTTGKPVSIKTAKITRDLDPSVGTRLNNMTLIVENIETDGTLVVLAPGEWIVHQPGNGYVALTQEQLEEKWAIAPME